MKKINATTTYNPNLSAMQEIEYTMPQAKKDIANCLMNALDNLKDQQAEIDTAIHLLDVANCPQCGDKSGAYPDPRDGSAIQCQWCYEVNELKAKHRGKG